MKNATLIKNLKEAGEDYEFYPTTNEIIEAMYWDLKSHRQNHWFGEDVQESCGPKEKLEYISLSMLDIGAGNGKVYSTLKSISEAEAYMVDDRVQTFNMMDVDYYAIEKSQILLNQLPLNTIVVGTNFDECTLIDKKVDVVFSNPPYKQYVQWTQKIIMEANAAFIYLVIPQRWGNHPGIANALKQRRARVKVIGNFDFLNAEDRKARAKVSLVKVYLCPYTHKSSIKLRNYDMSELKAKTDPFEIWFDNCFKINAERSSFNEESSYYKQEAEKEALKKELNGAIVAGIDLVSVLVKLYNVELNKLIANYQKLGELDSEILKELNVDIKSLLKAFRQKIEGLKNKYWKEVFSNLTAITARLTSDTRERLMNKLISNSNMDFTESNIRAIVIWVIKNASSYFEEQMISLYDKFTTGDSIRLYKSNKNFMNDNWRYAKSEKIEKYALDYRIVLHNWRDYFEETDNLVSRKQLQTIGDIIIVAKNLGFDVDSDYKPMDGKLHIGEKYNIYFNTKREQMLKKGTKTHNGKIEDVYELNPEDKQGKYQYLINDLWTHEDRVKTDEDVFTTVKGFKNGNTHYQFSQKFIKKLNLEVGRLRGWIKTPQEAAEEIDITIEEATEFWDSSFKLLPTHFSNLLPSFEEEAEDKELENEVAEDENDFIENESTDKSDEFIEYGRLDIVCTAPQSLFDFGGVA